MKIIILVALILFPASANAEVIYGKASWYSVEACQWNPHKACPTADGTSLYSLERSGELFCAMWDVRFGANVRVTNRENGRSVVVRVRDRGPHDRLNRVIDLGKTAFQKLADLKQGIINVKLEVL